MKPRIVVIGAGSMGTNISAALSSLGYDVSLLERGNDILTGAPQVTFINHGDGFEYFKPDHKTTGEYCVEGSLTKALFFPFSALTTGICSVSSPIRFLIASGSVKNGRIGPSEFASNAVHMQRHYARMYSALSRSAGLSDSDAEKVFVRPPGTFMRHLHNNEFEDVSGVVAGAYGIGFGINMPHYYALLKAALRQQRVDCHFGVSIEGLQKNTEGTYTVKANGREWHADHVLVCSSHHIPQLASSIQGADLTREFPGTYYLNCMTFLRLPKTTDEEKLRLSRKITFTLMDEHGCMLACVVPPTPELDGMAAVYFPSRNGSQLEEHTCARGDVSQPPESWDDLIKNGLPPDHPNVLACFNQARHLYPFLDGYAKISHAVCRTVFNVGVPGSELGADRRVREMSDDFHALTDDGRVSAWTAPKWTNAELTALMAVDYVLEQSGREPLPKSDEAGCGPTKLDVGKISQMFHFRDLKMKVADARHYAAQAKLPERMILTDLPQFQA